MSAKVGAAGFSRWARPINGPHARRIALSDRSEVCMVDVGLTDPQCDRFGHSRH